jgi:hypothetical protein
MARILLVGIDPDLVDFTAPEVPPGMNAGTIRRGIRAALDDFAVAGHDPHHLYIPLDPADQQLLSGKLATERFDCIVIGGGVRIPPSNLLLFEAVLNTIARAPSPPAIALVGHPGEATAAVARVLNQGG